MSQASETRPLKRSRISSKSWNKLFLVGVSTLIGSFLAARFLFSLLTSPLAASLYLLTHLLLDIYFIYKRKYFELLGMGIGIILSLFFLLKSQPTNGYERLGLIIEAKKNYFILLSKGHRYYVYDENTNHYFGDIVKLSGNATELTETTYEGRFSFVNYLNRKGVSYQIQASSITTIYQFLPIRIIEKNFLENFNSETSNLIDAILFSFKDLKDSLFQDSLTLGVYASLSGGGIILASYLRIYEPLLKKLPFKIKKLLRILLTIPFLVFAPTKVGLWKVALIDLSFLLLPSKRIKKEHRLTIVAFFLLLFDPYILLSSSFFLSFGLSFVFLLSSRLISRRKTKVGKMLFSRFLLEIFLFPNTVSLGRISLFSPLHRMIFIPLVLPFYLLSFFSFCSFPCLRALEGYASFIRNYLSFSSKIDLSFPFIGQNGEWVIILLYLLFIALLYLYDVGLNYLSKRLLGFVTLCFILNLLPSFNLLTSQVSFLNVGQGDSIIIREGLKTIMIDTGGNKGFDMGKEVDIPYLYKRKIYHLDYLIITHDDFDHNGAKDSLLKNFKVKHLIDDKSSFPLDIGNIHLENLNVYESNDDNDSSLVLYMEFLSKRWLFMGDAGVNIEKKIIQDNPNLKADIIKIGHHGSSSSTSEAFIRSIRPEIAIISCGATNYYGHPHQDVLDTLALYKVSIRRTDEEGTITYWGSRF